MQVKITTIRIDEDVFTEAKINSFKKNISLSKYIENLIKQDLQKEQEEK